MLRAVLFDFNGVLVDDEPIHLALFQEVLAEEGIELDREGYYRRYLGFDDRGAFSAILADAGQEAGAPRLARLIARKAAYYQERIRREGYPFFPGAAALLRSALARGWMLGVVSGALHDEVEGALRQLGVRDHFKAIVAAEDVAEGKPDPEGYLRALDALNSQPPLPERLFHPHEVLVIEDSPAGLAAAAAAGLPTLGVANTYPPEELAGAGAVLPSLEGVTAEILEQSYRRIVGPT
ncbi:MAG TPA: HAD family phosphatase [Thermoanaerobaculia bacterium]|nr:HAD family phosphatase [Thermoanaerobaculia bacterium]